MSYFSDEDEYEYRRYRGRDPSPAPVHYVQARPDRPRSRGYPHGMDPFLVPNVTERSMAITRVRERSRERRSPPTALSPPAQLPAPVIIKQYNSNDHHSSDDESSLSSHHHHRGRGRSHSHVSMRSSHSRSRGGSDAYMTVERYELERKLEEGRRQLEALRVSTSSSAAAHAEAERYELQRLKRELEELRVREDRDAQRAEDAERWELRKSKIELEDLRAREAREAREKADRERRSADYESYELQRSKKELQDLKAQQQREKEAMEKMREARTQAELRVAKEELDKSELFIREARMMTAYTKLQSYATRPLSGMLTCGQSNSPRSKRPTRRGSARR